MDIDSYDASNPEGVAATPALVPKPHDALWLPDGNVVLATDKYLFRVHKSVLSRHSSVFKDMFGLPTVDGPIAGGMAPELYEGLPLVRLAGDDGDDVVHLLRATYDRPYYKCDDDDTPLEVITALLLLSTKYDFKDIRSDVIKHILRHYPTTFHEYEAVGDDLSKHMFGKTRPRCHTPLLKAALVANVEILQPPLYYAVCSTFILDYFFGDFDGPLDPRCLKLLVCGKESMSKAMHSIISVYLQESERCIHLHHGDGNVGSFKLTGLRIFLDSSKLSLISWKRLEEQWPHRVCAECKGNLETKIEEMRAQIWDILPSFFRLPDWNTLRANCEV